MELNRFLRILRKGLLTILVFSVIGVGAGLLAVALTPVQYTSATRLFVTLQIFPGSTSGDLVQGNNFAVQKVLSYVDVVTSPRVLDPVIDELGLDTTAADLAGDVAATVQPQSVVIEIAGTAATASAASELTDAVATSFTDVVVNQLETPVDGSASPVKVQTLQPASSPSSPSSPQVPLFLGLGLVIGLAAGVVVVLVLGFADRRLHSRADVVETTDLRILGAIARNRRLIRDPLATTTDPSGTTAEEYRAVRTNLQFVGFEGGARSLVVTSATELEGKTTVVANLATVLAQGGATVAVIDADLRSAQLSALFRAEGKTGLSDVLTGRSVLADALVRAEGGLVILPAGSAASNRSEILGSTAMADVLTALTNQFDYVLIDSPAVLAVTDAAVLGRMTSGAVLVVGMHRVKENELLTAMETISDAGGLLAGLVLNSTSRRGADADVVTSAVRRVPVDRRGRRRVGGRAALGEVKTGEQRRVADSPSQTLV